MSALASLLRALRPCRQPQLRERQGGIDIRSERTPRVLPSAEPTVTLRNRSNAVVSHFAVLAIPAHLSGEADGTLIVYLDQSEQANALSRYFGLIAGVTLLL